MRQLCQSAMLLLLALVTLPAQAEAPLVLGVFPYVSPAQLMAFHRPLAQHVSEVVSRPVELVSASNFGAFVEATRRGDYDLVLTAPHLGRLAETRDGYRRVVRSRHEVQGVFLARRDSQIERLEDLEGKVLMMAQRVSIIFQMAEESLRQHGLVDGRNIRVIETRTHNNAMWAPLRGEADASVTGTLLLDKLEHAQKDELRIIGRTPAVPGFMLMANARLPAAQVKRLQADLPGWADTPEGDAYFGTNGLIGFALIDEPEMQSLDPYTKVLDPQP